MAGETVVHVDSVWSRGFDRFLLRKRPLRGRLSIRCEKPSGSYQFSGIQESIDSIR
jgi:hypothetical protein